MRRIESPGKQDRQGRARTTRNTEVEGGPYFNPGKRVVVIVPLFWASSEPPLLRDRPSTSSPTAAVGYADYLVILFSSEG